MKTLVELLDRSTKLYPTLPFLGTKTSSGFEYITYAEFNKRVEKSRGLLQAQGVKKGDAIALISDNRVEWAEVAFAAFTLGATLTPMYESQLDKDWLYILQDCKAKLLFVSSAAIRKRIATFENDIAALEAVFVFDERSSSESYEQAREKSEAVPKGSVDDSDIASLIYTSGTTGKPKGVMLSHGNFASNVSTVEKLFPIETSDRTCSFLPWAHCFGQCAELFVMMSQGAQLAIAESPKTLLEDFALSEPTILYAVPAVFQKIYDAVNVKIEGAPAPIRKRIRRALKNKPSGILGTLENALLDKIFFSKVRARFGGRLRYAVSGGAKLDINIAEFLDAIGIVIFEGYGLTETSPIISCNTPLDFRMGTVGKAIDGVDVIITDLSQTLLGKNTSGEVCAAGPNIMQGYYGRQADTDAVFFEHKGKRYFRTGDMGTLDDDGFLRITGRYKEQYKLENGKYVVPTPIEDSLSLNPLFEQVFLFGDGQHHNVCLVVLDEEAKTRLKNESKEALHKRVEDALDESGQSLKSYERPRAFAIIDEAFSPENGLLTPKLSKKRNNIVERYKAVIDGLYKNG